MRQHQSSGPLTPSLGLIMRLRTVAREHHTVADAAARFGSTPLAGISKADVRSSSQADPAAAASISTSLVVQPWPIRRC
jgi:uncharacterized protein YciI